MKNEVKEAKKKIEMLTNLLLDSIDIDLLSDSPKTAYLKAIQHYVVPVPSQGVGTMGHIKS